MAQKKKKDKKKKTRKNFIFRVCVLAFAAYAAILLIDMQVTLGQKRQELEELKKQYETQRLTNKEAARHLEDGVDEETIERIARDELGYVAENEVVFYDISGS